MKELVPRRIRALRGRLANARGRREFRGLDVEETFERVYSKGWWGTGKDFDSGHGSEGPVIQPYVDAIRGFIADHGINSVADLGCGDFRIGSQIAQTDVSYVGVDVVGGLIERNKRLYESPTVTFRQVNLIEGELPQAQLGLLRQVLQHLSNEQIEAVLENARAYPYLIVTEHLPLGPDVGPNRDMPHGPDIRLQARSGVFVDEPPFSRPARLLCEVPLRPGEVLRTVVIEHPAAVVPDAR